MTPGGRLITQPQQHNRTIPRSALTAAPAGDFCAVRNAEKVPDIPGELAASAGRRAAPSGAPTLTGSRGTQTAGR